MVKLHCRPKVEYRINIQHQQPLSILPSTEFEQLVEQTIVDAGWQTRSCHQGWVNADYNDYSVRYHRGIGVETLWVVYHPRFIAINGTCYYYMSPEDIRQFKIILENVCD